MILFPWLVDGGFYRFIYTLVWLFTNEFPALTIDLDPEAAVFGFSASLALYGDDILI